MNKVHSLKRLLVASTIIALSVVGGSASAERRQPVVLGRSEIALRRRSPPDSTACRFRPRNWTRNAVEKNE
ncbi:MAG: hypothetical protein H6947_05225 [Zoogloeaceae bacterium]|nr:hypothetical protein [Zoogloeaceae bacterium]